MKYFEIMFSDLTKEAQEQLLATFETTEEDENWEIVPLTTIERFEEDDELIDDEDSDEDFDEPNY